MTSRPAQVPQASGEQLRGSGANPPGAPPEAGPSLGNPGPQQAAPVLLPRRRLNRDSSWAPKRVATASASGGLQKAQSVQSLVPQGEEPGGLSSRCGERGAHGHARGKWPHVALMCHCACQWEPLSGYVQGTAAPGELSLSTRDAVLTT